MGEGVPKEQTARGNTESLIIILEGDNNLGPHSVFLLMLAFSVNTEECQKVVQIWHELGNLIENNILFNSIVQNHEF